ncbi:VWA domain-containing protein [Acidisoma cellulosilytica]|uniref:VWA domain-containing protein n=1 Tax=Acidisoma cellulosilyticum TaxID=2802395 RepID=A0A963Z5X0_9PROT|nr:VWA domain-containing protein [Acidisoma cellulosilyticum]MCB8883131.1 VWA domain-containing protein [Acidisoma cellulosilyticum]
MAAFATTPGAAATARIAGFVATLRSNGFVIGQRETEDALSLAGSVGIMERQPLRWGWRSLLCTRAADWVRFDDLFDSYWLPPNKQGLGETRAGGAGLVTMAEDAWNGAGRAGPVLQRDEVEDDTGLPGDTAAQDGASATATIETADFRSLSDRLQTYAIEAAIRDFARRLKRLRIRREQSRRRGARIDLRQTLRLSVGTGGSPHTLRFRAPRRVRPRLVLLLDVSRSMSLTSFFYLRVARSLALELGDVHVFLYHTQLTHVSEALRDSDPWRAQERLQLLSAGWAGGTRIGECLGSFNRLHAGRLVHARTAVIVASDGYDTGPAGILGAEMAALSRRAHRIIWFNPAKADPRYAPVARGMREAMPFIDLLTAGNSLTALEAALSQVVASL